MLVWFITLISLSIKPLHVLSNNYEFKPQYVDMLPILPMFTSLEFEDAYEFISEFQEVCVMLKSQYLSEDAINLRFILFALKDYTKSGYIHCLLIQLPLRMNSSLFSLESSTIIIRWQKFVTRSIISVN